jgi:hypothetical protein
MQIPVFAGDATKREERWTFSTFRYRKKFVTIRASVLLLHKRYCK